MVRTFRYPLRPTKAQVAVFDAWLIACRELHNAALQERRDAWRVARKPVTRYDQALALTEVRAADPAQAAVPARVQRYALDRVDRAFVGFFRRCKEGRTPGYPRFQSRRRYRSFGFPFQSTTGNRVRVPLLGFVKFCAYRPIQGRPRTVSVSRDRAGAWWVAFACDIGEAPDKVPVRSAVGIDLGLHAFATVSDGAVIDNPRFTHRAQTRLTRRQRVLSRRQRHSSSRERARVLVAKAYRHIQQQRKDFFRKLSKQLLDRYDLVAHEDLNIRGMGRGHFARSVHDAAWGTFLRCLASKAESAGKHVIAVDPRGTTQRCSGCGVTVKKSLAERTHRCSCGVVLDRDHNAAINILALGRSAVEAGQPAGEAERAS